MKLTRKLIPAMIMLLVSAVLMSTASFAWFAMNTTVKAQGMAVKAKADSIFLEISGKQDKKGETDVWGTTGTDMVVDEETGKVTTPVQLYPVDHKAFTKPADIDTNTSWFFKYVTDPNNATTGASEDKAIGAFGDYVYKTTYKVRLNPNMVNKAYDLYVSSISIPVDTGITVIICCDQGADDTAANIQEFSETSNSIEWSAEKNLADELVMEDANDYCVVSVYIYIDGTHEKVYTNNAAALAGEVEFTLSASGANRG